jgi:hypothetical protein
VRLIIYLSVSVASSYSTLICLHPLMLLDVTTVDPQIGPIFTEAVSPTSLSSSHLSCPSLFEYYHLFHVFSAALFVMFFPFFIAAISCEDKVSTSVNLFSQ